jgi:hypothetical protein
VYWSRVEATGRSAGASLHTLYGLGGASARRMALGLQTATDGHLTLFFSLVRALQAPPRRVLIRVNSGLNDRNETLASLGPAAVADGDSPEALADNLRAVLGRVEQVWALNGWPEDELFSLLTVSHPIGDPDDAELLAYREAVDALARERPRCASVRLDRLATAGEMVALGWYAGGGSDRNHLTAAGAEGLARRELAAILPRCAGDADGDGDADFEDLTRVLASWGLCAPGPGGGDADGDARVTFADITAVLTWWGACGGA